MLWAVECCFYHYSWGFVFCVVWPVKSWCYRKELDLNSRGGRPESRTLDHQRTPKSMEHLSTRTLPKASISTLRPSPLQRPASFRAAHLRSKLQQNRNSTLSTSRQASQSHTKPTDTPAHYWIWHCSSEKQDTAPSTRTEAQVPQNRKPSQSLVQPHPRR